MKGTKGKVKEASRFDGGKMEQVWRKRKEGHKGFEERGKVPGFTENIPGSQNFGGISATRVKKAQKNSDAKGGSVWEKKVGGGG